MNNVREKESIKEFNKWAESYDKNFWSLYFKSAYHHVLALSEKYINHDSKILDVGCGTGDLAFLVSKKATEGKVVGLDISQQMIELAQKKKLERNISNVQFINSRANSIPYENEYFDLVFCLNALHHIPDHPSFFQETNRVLKKDGRFVILDLIKDNIIRKAWLWVSKFIFGEKDIEYHSRKDFLKFLRNAGFEPEIQKSFLFFTLISISKKL